MIQVIIRRQSSQEFRWIGLYYYSWLTSSKDLSSSTQRRRIINSYFSLSADASNESFALEKGFSRIFTNEQRKLLRQVHQLSSTSRTLAQQVGNVPFKEDSLLAEIVRLQNQRIRHTEESFLTEKSIDGSIRYDTERKPNDEVSTDPHGFAAPSALFTILFAGEFNSGKSTLINALLGKEVLESGVLPTTDAITILMSRDEEDAGEAHFVASSASQTTKFDSNEMRFREQPLDLAHGLAKLHTLPLDQYPILSDLCLIDTPGTNAVLSLQHTASTLRILHDADLIVFVTSADRPFSESEQQLLRTSIKAYHKRVVLVINKMDILERQRGEDHGEITKSRVVDYVTDHARDLLGSSSVVIPLSARDALSVKLLKADAGGTSYDDSQCRSLWERSNFSTLEHYLSDTLTASSKIKTKLLNPLGVAEGILLDCQNELVKREDEFQVNVMTLRLLNSQASAWEEEIKSVVFDQCRSDMNDVFTKTGQMVDLLLIRLSYIDQLKIGLGLGRAEFDVAWEDATRDSLGIIQSSFSKRDNQHYARFHLNTLERVLLTIASEVAESLTSKAKIQGEATVEYIVKRPSAINSSCNGSSVQSSIVGVSKISAPSFLRLRDDVDISVTNLIQSSVARHPSDNQCAHDVYTQLRRTAFLSNLMFASAAIAPALSLFNVVDIFTGMSLGSLLLTLGGAILPLGNGQAKRLFQLKWSNHAAHLDKSLEALFRDVMKRVVMQMMDSVAPYSRYVKAEGQRLEELRIQVDCSIRNASGLRCQINKEHGG